MDLFENVKRSKAEMRVVGLFISKYEKGIEDYNNHSYRSALSEFIESINILVPIYDLIPKCKVSHYIMKSKYKCGFYKETLTEITDLLQLISKLDHESDLYIKIQTKIFLYRITSNIILNNSTESISNTIEAIDYFRSKQYTLETKALMFWIFIKGFLGEGKLNKTRQFAQFKDYYDELNQQIESTGEINKIIKDVYKTLMSTKNRKVLFDNFNKLFYWHKYNQPITNKIIQFLIVNIPGHVRADSMNIFKENFKNYIKYNKIDLSETWGNITMMDLVNEARIRLVSFDTLYCNLCGAFDVIFSEYYGASFAKKQVTALESLSPRLSLLDMTMSNAHHVRKSITKDDSINNLSQNLQQFPIFDYMNKNKGNNNNTNNALHKDIRQSLLMLNNITAFQMRNSLRNSKECFFPFLLFQKDIVVPPNTNKEEDDDIAIKQQHMQLKKTKSTATLFSNQKFSYTRRKTSMDKMQRFKNGTQLNSAVQTSLKSKQYHLYQIQQQISTQSTISNTSELCYSKYPLRNYNNYLFNIIVQHLMNKPVLKHSDFTDVIRLFNTVTAYASKTEKGIHTIPLSSNQDTSFTCEHFLLIKNFHIFGICDGHGKFGKEVAEAVCLFFLSNLFYIIIDINLTERKVNLNQIIISLFKLKEKPKIKEMNIIRYLLNKFEFAYDKLSYAQNSFVDIKNEIIEAIARTHQDCKNRKQIDIDSSGCTLCSVFVYGKTLYLVNIGDSRAVLGTNIYEENIWRPKQLTMDHKPEKSTEAKRITSFGGRIAQNKNEEGKDIGPFRVWSKDSNQGPGLSMSRSIGDHLGKKIGITYEPDVFEFKLEPNDKIIIIGSDGLWDLISMTEAIWLCGKLYEGGKSADDAASELKSKVKNTIEVKDLKTYDDITCIVIFLNIK